MNRVEFIAGLEKMIGLNSLLLTALVRCLFPLQTVQAKSKLKCFSGKKYPGLNDRIAIIGAGPSGVHMAYKLQNLGYKDITIFEKTDRIGGKSYTYDYKGTKQDLGTIYTASEYTEIFKLVNEFNYSSLIPVSERTMWTNLTQYSLFSTYIVSVIMQEYGISDQAEAIKFLRSAMLKYVGLHRSMFSEYEGDIFPRPGPDVLKQTSGTIMDFLIRNDITVLKHLFLMTYTAMGYGKLDEVSALYGLIWNTPKLLLSVFDSTDRGIYILKDGFQGLWEVVANQRKMNVIFNAEITSIKRRGKVSIRYHNRDDENSYDSERVNTFDFLILACDIIELFNTNTVKDASRREFRIFRKPIFSYLTVTIAESEYGRRAISPIDTFLFSLKSKNDHEIYAKVDKYGIMQNLLYENYTSGRFPGNSLNESLETVLCYQTGNSEPTVNILNDKLESYVDNFYVDKNFTVIKRVSWIYSPKFSPEDMSSGILWDILDMQGYQNTWYTGSAVSFESVKSVAEYNNLLLRKFNLTN